MGRSLRIPGRRFRRIRRPRGSQPLIRGDISGADEVALGARSEDAGPVEIAETVPGDGKSPVEWLGQIPTRLQAGPSRIGAGGAP